MELEELPPNKPNFLLVVLLFAGVILAVAIVAVVFIHLEGKHMMPHTFTKHAQSRLVLPFGSGPVQG